MPLGKLVVREPDYGSGERAIPIQSPTDVKYIRITDFDNDGIVPGNEFATVENIENRYRLDDRDVLFARSGATAGKTFIYSSYIGPSIFAGYCIRFRFNRKEALPEFIYFYTKTNRYQAWVRSIQRPSGQPNINKEEFKSFTVPLPPVPVQRSLVSEMEAARESRRHKLAEADALLSGLDAFLLDHVGIKQPVEISGKAFAIRKAQLDGPLNPKRYRGLALEEGIKGSTIDHVGDVIEEKTNPSSIAPEDEWDWIRIDDLENEPLGVDAIRTAVGREIEGSFFAVRENDILVARLGPTILNRKFILCPKTHRQTVASGEFLVLRTRSGWNPVVVLWLLRTGIYRDLIYSKARGATPSRYRVNRDDFTKLPFPLVSDVVQRKLAVEIADRLRNVRRLREEATREWEAAKAHFESRVLGKEAAL